MYRKWKGSERLAETISHMGNISHPKPKDYRRRLSKRRFAPALELGGCIFTPGGLIYMNAEKTLSRYFSPLLGKKNDET